MRHGRAKGSLHDLKFRHHDQCWGNTRDISATVCTLSYTKTAHTQGHMQWESGRARYLRDLCMLFLTCVCGQACWRTSANVFGVLTCMRIPRHACATGGMAAQASPRVPSSHLEEEKVRGPAVLSLEYRHATCNTHARARARTYTHTHTHSVFMVYKWCK
jgi:hypothetical protein